MKNYAIFGLGVICLAGGALLNAFTPSEDVELAGPYDEFDPSAEAPADVYVRATEIAKVDDIARVDLEQAMADRKLTNGEFETMSLRFLDRQATKQHEEAKEKLWQELVARGEKRQSSVD